MKRVFVLAAAALLCACGGDDVKFNLKSPPLWLVKLDSALPAKPLQRNELTGDCVGVPFRGQCRADVSESKSLTRKARFKGSKARITYTPNEQANPVTITLRGEATVPIRRSGGRLTFVCLSFDPCRIAMQ
jgi:hypothetical protein